MSVVRLNRITILGFGGLPAGSTYDFCDGLNVTLKENGEGKTRLIEALCAGLYGFLNENVKSNAEVVKYRVRFKPWNGGSYGVKLEFTVDGIAYEAVRRFGDRASLDTFELKDLRLGIPSDKYTMNLGEELFGLDHESFRRSLLIGCGDVLAEDSVALNSRIGHFSAEQNDRDVYKKAKKCIAESKKGLSGNANSKYGIKKARVTELEKALRGTEGLEEEVNRLEVFLFAEQEKKAEAEAELLQKQELQRNLAAIKELEANRQIYDTYQKQIDASAIHRADEMVYFPGGVPDREKLLQGRELCAAYFRQKEARERYRFTPEEVEEYRRLQADFSKGVPDLSALERMEQIAAELPEAKKRLEQRRLSEHEERILSEGRLKYAGKEPNGQRDKDYLVEYCPTLSDEADRMLRLLQSYADMEEDFAKQEEKRRELDQKAAEAYEKRQKKPSARYVVMSAIFFVLAAAAFIAGTLLVGRGSLITGIGSLVIGCIALVLGIVFLGKNRRLLLEHRKRSAEVSSEEVEAAAFSERLDEMSMRMQQIREELSAYFDRFALGEFHPRYAYTSLSDHRRCLQEYERLEEQKKRFNQDGLETEVSKKLEELESFLATFGKQLTEEPGRQLLHLRTDLQRLEKLTGQKQEFEICSEACTQKRDSLCETLENLGAKPDETDGVQGKNLYDFFSDLLEHLSALERCREEEKQARETMEHFLDRFSPREREQLMMPEWKRPENLLGVEMEDLSEAVDSLQEVIRKRNDSLQSGKETLRELQSRLTEAEGLKAEKEEKQQEVRELEESARLLKLTEECLETARQEMTHRYVDPLLERIRCYYEVITGRNDSELLHLNADLKLTMEAEGTERNLHNLSNGYQDLIGFARRVAYADTLFAEGGKPILVLDDPFVYLDDGNLTNAWHLLESLAEEYQVLYFTCSSARIHLA